MPNPIQLPPPNVPRVELFPCPGCGRQCELEPKFYTEGAAKGVRHGHGVRHALPVCTTYKLLSTHDFLKLAIAEVPQLQADPHVSVKEPAALPLIVADMGQATAAQAERAREQQATDVAAAAAEARELGLVRDRLRERDPKEPTGIRRVIAWFTVRRTVEVLVVTAVVYGLIHELTK